MLFDLSGVLYFYYILKPLSFYAFQPFNFQVRGLLFIYFYTFNSEKKKEKISVSFLLYLPSAQN